MKAINLFVLIGVLIFLSLIPAVNAGQYSYSIYWGGDAGNPESLIAPQFKTPTTMDCIVNFTSYINTSGTSGSYSIDTDFYNPIGTLAGSSNPTYTSDQACKSMGKIELDVPSGYNNKFYEGRTITTKTGGGGKTNWYQPMFQHYDIQCIYIYHPLHPE